MSEVEVEILEVKDVIMPEEKDNEPACDRVLVSFETEGVEDQLEVDILFKNYEESNACGDRGYRVYGTLKQHLLEHRPDRFFSASKITFVEGLRDCVPREEMQKTFLDLTGRDSFVGPQYDQPMEQAIIALNQQRDKRYELKEKKLIKKRNLLKKLKEKKLGNSSQIKFLMELVNQDII